MDNLVILGLGGNVGGVRQILDEAIVEIEKNIGMIDKRSSLYQTKAWGKENQPDFINQVLGVFTKLPSEKVLEQCLGIEAKLGRERVLGVKWRERKIDIDILLYGCEVLTTDSLIIPHPHMHERNFVLEPLREIYPDTIHPIMNENISKLLEICGDSLEVSKL